jgi:hypothetical protein
MKKAVSGLSLSSTTGFSKWRIQSTKVIQSRNISRKITGSMRQGQVIKSGSYSWKEAYKFG